LVLKSNGIQKTRELAKAFCEEAKNDLSVFPDSDAKTALMDLTNTLITRTK
jgi:hexaprenyl-diphosphate synthase